MLFNNGLLLACAATLATASAKPVNQVASRSASDLTSFTLKAKPQYSTVPFNNKPLNFWYGGLYIGHNTTTDCPSGITSCGNFKNVTAISVSNTNSRASTDTFVPGGQIVYVAATGQVEYTAPHAQNVPTDAYQTGWARTEVFPTHGSAYAKATFKGQDFVACPVNNQEGVWTVQSTYIGFTDPCIPFEAVVDQDLTGEGAAAYEYSAASK